MAKLVAEEHKDFLLLPADSILFLKVADCEVREVERRSGSGGSWQKIEFTFNITGIQHVGDGSDPSEYSEIVGTKIWGSAPFRLTDSEENKLKRWVEAILGVQVTVGFELDTDYLVNRECRGTTTQYEKKNINHVTGLPYKGHQIQDLLPKGGGNNVLGGWGAQTRAADPWAAQNPPAQQAQPQQQQLVSPGAGGQDSWGSLDDPPF
jgi:hypothetical protein